MDSVYARLRFSLSAEEALEVEWYSSFASQTGSCGLGKGRPTTRIPRPRVSVKFRPSERVPERTARRIAPVVEFVLAFAWVEWM